MRRPWFLLGVLAAACGGNPIQGTWRSDGADPPIVLELDEEGAGTLTINEFVYVATAYEVRGYTYVIEQCSLFPEVDPSCREHVCEFDHPDEDLFDTWDEGPDFTVLLCAFDGEGRWLYLD